MKHYINTLKEKPEHVRARIAFSASAGITALIGVIWVGAMAASGAFALGPANGKAVAQEDASPVALTSTNVKSNFSQLLGAVGSVTNATSTKPALTIVNGEATSTFDTHDETPVSASATSIPF